MLQAVTDILSHDFPYLLGTSYLLYLILVYCKTEKPYLVLKNLMIRKSACWSFRREERESLTIKSLSSGQLMLMEVSNGPKSSNFL